MRRRDTLIVFVRQPALGRVKRRLAADLGAVAARRIYAGLTRRALGRLAGAPTWRTVLAVTPDRARWRGWPRRVARVGQGGGDLGTRMGRALRRLATPRAVLIGWRRGVWPAGALAGVRWSSAHALADSRATLPAATVVALVDTLTDLDDAAAYRAWRARRQPG